MGSEMCIRDSLKDGLIDRDICNAKPTTSHPAPSVADDEDEKKVRVRVKLNKGEKN